MLNYLIRLWHKDITPVRAFLGTQQQLLRQVYFKDRDFEQALQDSLQALKSGKNERVVNTYRRMREAVASYGEKHQSDDGARKIEDYAGIGVFDEVEAADPPIFLLRMGDYVKFVADITKQDPSALVVSLNAANANHPGGAVTYGPGSAEEAYARLSNLLIEIILNHMNGERQRELLVLLLETVQRLHQKPDEAEAREVIERFRRKAINLVLQQDESYHIPKAVAESIHVNPYVYTVSADPDGGKTLHHSVVVDIAATDLRPMSPDIDLTEKVKSTFNYQALSPEQLQQLKDDLEAYILMAIELAEKNPHRTIYLNMLPIGCGAFKNPPAEIAQLFYELLIQYRDLLAKHKIVSVMSSFEDNYDVFKACFVQEDFRQAFELITRREKVIAEIVFDREDQISIEGLEYISPEIDPTKLRLRFVQGSLQHLPESCHYLVCEDNKRFKLAPQNRHKVAVAVPHYNDEPHATETMIKIYRKALQDFNKKLSVDNKGDVALTLLGLGELGWPAEIVSKAVIIAIALEFQGINNIQSLTIIDHKVQPIQKLYAFYREDEDEEKKVLDGQVDITNIKDVVRERGLDCSKEEDNQAIAQIIIDRIDSSVKSAAQLEAIFNAVGIGYGDKAGDDLALSQLRHRQRWHSQNPWRETNDSEAIARAGFDKLQQLLKDHFYRMSDAREYAIFEDLFSRSICRSEAESQRAKLVDWFHRHGVRDYELEPVEANPVNIF